MRDANHETRDELLRLERSALARWLDGDPSGFLEISDEDVVYFDPFLERRLDGLSSLHAYYERLRGTIHAEHFEILNPHVQVSGSAKPDMAVLTYNFVSRAGGTPMRWNSTEVYRRRRDSWKLIHSHWSLVQPPMQGA